SETVGKDGRFTLKHTQNITPFRLLFPINLGITALRKEGETMDTVPGGAVTIPLFLGAYFMPSLIAFLRQHHNTDVICTVNILLGWTALGWVAALIWSFTAVKEP